ncbi:MAG TPA: glycosyltransferase family 4 protein [Rhodocyclaceae bacterium]|nr:glycosyltransferase family 4 protein [Rhodocyclaceae bacterium]
MTQLQRVLFSESSPNIGGQELQLLEQASGLQRQGVAVHLVCRANSRIASVALERGIPTTHLPFRNSLHPPSILGLRRLLREFKPDVVISHSGHDANAVAVAARLLKKRPRLVRARTYQPGVPSAWTYNTLVDLTLVPSEYLKSRLLQNPRIKAERIAVLYPGIPFADNDAKCKQQLPPELLAQLQIGKRRLLVHAAMLRTEKGHALMLDVLPRLLEKFPDLLYVIAGEGELYETLYRRASNEGLGQNVLFAGMVTQLPALMLHAELLVMPSLYEPLGMSQIEALSHNIPVVASRTGGIPETVEDMRSGLLAEPGDVDDWLAKLSWALEHPEAMRAMAAQGNINVRARFCISENLRRLQAFLSGLLKA